MLNSLRQKDARVIASDLAWTIGSIGAVWLYAAVNTQSFFIAFVGMFEILISFPIALVIYRLIFRIEYVGNITGLSIFILLGIGADDIFVYFDAYRQSAHEPRERERISRDRLLWQPTGVEGDLRHVADDDWCVLGYRIVVHHAARGIRYHVSAATMISVMFRGTRSLFRRRSSYTRVTFSR